MDNTHLSPGGEEASRPTEQFWSGPGPTGQPGAGPATGGAASGQPGPGYGQPWGAGPAYHQQPGLEPSGRRPRDRRRMVRWSAGAAAAVLLAGGGAVLGVSLAGSPSPGSALAAASSPASTSGNAAQGAVLSAALSAADSTAAPGYLNSAGAGAAGASGGNGSTRLARRCAAARAAVAGRPAAALVRRACRLRFIVRALALRGVHGEFTVRGKNGFRVLAFERGTIQSVTSGKDIVVRASDGTTWTWQLVSGTVVREGGHKTGTSALAQGERVWTGGPVSGGAKDARLIVIRPKSATPAPTGSPSAS